MIQDNIKEFIDFKGITPYKFCKDVGFSMGYLDKKGAIGTDKYLKIIEYYPEINAEWLLTGKGSMLKESSEPLKLNLDRKLIPLYDGVAVAGRSAVADMSPANEPTDMVDAGDWFRDATAAMRVHGDSMYPDYHSGSIVAVKEVYNKRLIVFGQDYLIETTEYRILKRLQKSTEKQNWLACSTNQEVWESGEMKGRLIHEPFDIHIDDVGRLFQVLGSVKRNQSSRIVSL